MKEHYTAKVYDLFLMKGIVSHGEELFIIEDRTVTERTYKKCKYKPFSLEKAFYL